ncbi:glycerate kinase [Lentzea albidocapillata subsp. violacea]|uniref:Glycerate kinase n=1 Tax=Lentzea albidocapillata subsp. violacea TaxID=128104 RepID=A0A1G8U6E8_9PSEU|nr:glycerate kinase [Lentzea albidocapillata]SDJ49307.1 glycerate kinase [Lentzea albidocapillata subsp. violacea]
MRVLIAPDSFKGTIDAAGAAEAIAAGWRAVRPHDELRCLPLADGGEGTLAALTTAGAELVPVRVLDPVGRAIDAHWALKRDGTAVVELAAAAGLPLLAHPAPPAAAAGLPLLAQRAPLTASTFGFGQLLRAAAEHPGTRRIVAALGGSATTDGGAGALTALGAVFRTAEGTPIASGGGGLNTIASADLSALVPPGDVVCLVDVDTPLLGPTGAARRFAPQKGADADDVVLLEAGLARFAAVLGGDRDAPGTGAAGGTAFGLATAWGARLTPGARFVADLAGLPAALRWADLLITGEGRLDEQSWSGKVVGHAMTCFDNVALVVGSCATEVPDGVACASLTELAGDGRLARREPARWLAAAGGWLAAADQRRPGPHG